MKTTITSLMFILTCFAGTPILQDVPVTHIYAPDGFDSNDSTEVILEGFLPNLCHKTPKTDVLIKGKTININLKSLYYHESNPFCPTMIVPFLTSVDLGVLKKGSYQIIVNGKSIYEKKSQVNIVLSKSDLIDDFQYSYVSSINKDEKSNKIVMEGLNPSDCFVFDKVDYISNKKDTYAVLPKMRQIREDCPMKMVPFKIEWELPEEIERESVLLHVRTLNGKSINKVVSTK